MRGKLGAAGRRLGVRSRARAKAKAVLKVDATRTVSDVVVDFAVQAGQRPVRTAHAVSDYSQFR